MTRTVLRVAAALGGLALLAFFLVVPGYVEGRLNRVTAAPAAPHPEARTLHRRILVADLHADSLLWGRDLLARGARGHVDVPRLLEGNVALQVFAVVTQVPFGQNLQSNDGRSDEITLLALALRWPPATWRSLRARALYQAQRLRDFAARSDGRLVVVQSGAGLRGVLEARRSGRAVTAGLLALEGAQSLEGDAANVDVLFDAGYRMMSPSHFFDTEWGGSAHGVAKGGLTAKGREMIRRMEARGMILDLAHASPALIDDALALATRPVVVSHTGVKGTCDNIRNLSDDQLRGVARTGGVVGIGFWQAAVCGGDAAAVARAARHAAAVAGVEHVALGSDFDGAVATPFDASQLVVVTDALLQAGFSDTEVAGIMGGNALRVLEQTLP